MFCFRLPDPIFLLYSTRMFRLHIGAFYMCMCSFYRYFLKCGLNPKRAVRDGPLRADDVLLFRRNKRTWSQSGLCDHVAQRVGFEPTWDFSQTDFESAPL